MDRRTFVETSTLLAGGALLKGAPVADGPALVDDVPGARVSVPAPGGDIFADAPMIGIQAGAVSFVDEGTAKVLDNFQEMAAVNTIFLATFTYGRGIAGRQVPGSPLPDHGKQEYDTATFHGGNFATPHPQYYRDTSILPEKAPDHGGYDGTADALRAGHGRGMKVICWFEDVIGANVARL